MAFTLQPGEKAKPFSLPATDGQTYSLDSFKDRQVLVVVFTCNHCPHAIGVEDRLVAFSAAYGSRGVGLIAINSNETDGHPTDSFEHMVSRAREKGFSFPYTRDEDQTVAKAYGALRTPHFYVFDADRTLVYTGRMDNNTTDASQATTHELKDAVEAILAGKPVPTPLTNPIGCNVKWNGKDAHWMPADACDLVPRSA